MAFCRARLEALVRSIHARRMTSPRPTPPRLPVVPSAVFVGTLAVRRPATARVHIRCESVQPGIMPAGRFPEFAHSNNVLCGIYAA